MADLVKVILELLKRPGTIPLAIGAVLAATGRILHPTAGAEVEPSVLAPYADEIFMAGVAIALVGLVWLGLRPRPPSRLAKPEALQKVSEAFVGRGDDQKNLSELVRNHPLVFLVGESGAGKSTLLRRGVLNELQNDSAYLPAYHSYWGQDWEKDVRESLTRALRDSSGDAKLTPEGLIPWLAAQQPGGRLPVLLFDQFDDYITRHRAHFLPDEKSGRVLTVKELRERNRLWGELSGLVEKGLIHCVFTVREEMQWGLTCARFRAEETYLLPRLGRGIAAGLLNELTKDDAIGEPEGGWQALKDRLCGDLERDGLLPIRMRLVFQSLPALSRRLTLRAYEGIGGLVGLEATHIGDQTDEAARLSGVSPGALRKVLVEMVDRESQKTVVRAEAQLLATLDGSNGDGSLVEPLVGAEPARSTVGAVTQPSQASAIGTALELLAKQEITRQRLEARSIDAVWQLDHDYLANAVIELDKRDNRWRYVLEDKARRFRDAGTWVARFKTLLSPWEQVRIALQAARPARHRLRYAPHQRFAALSALRLVLNPWLPLIVVVAMTANWWWIQEQARDLYSWIGHSSSISDTEAQALWDMTQSSDAVRRAVVRTALALPGDAVRFVAALGRFSSTGSRSDYVLQSTVAMDQVQRQAILDKHISGTCSDAGLENADQLRACAFAAVQLDGPAFVTSKLIIAAMEKTTSSSQLSSLAQGLAGLGERLSAEEAAAGARRIVAAMEKTVSPSALRSLAQGLAGLGERLSAEAAAAVARRIVAAMERATDPGQLSSLAQGLAGLAERLSAEEATAVARRIVAAMEKATDPDQLSSLAQGLAGVGERLEVPAATEALDGAASRVREIAQPPCDAFAPLIRGENLSYVVEELLKWPTCSARDRERLITRIADVTGDGEQFGCPEASDDEQCEPDWWAFVGWAERAGYDVVRSPIPPDRILD